MKTQLMIKQSYQLNDAEIIQVLHQNDNRFGGVDYIGFDNENRGYSWREQNDMRRYVGCHNS